MEQKEKISFLCLVLSWLRERKRKGREHSSFFLLSLEFRWSELVEPRVKVHLLDGGYAWVPKMRGFTKIQMRIFREIKYFELGRLPAHVTTLQEVAVFLLWIISTLRVVWL